MQVLTPSGYKSPAAMANGDQVCAFDAGSGAPIVNTVENIDFVDHLEWCRWWSEEEAVPAFNWVRINGSFMLFGEQSVWRNGANVCHAKHLVVGDTIYDDADHPAVITSIEVVEDNSLVWYRFDISGDHSYIVDGLTVHNASRFWVGGTGTWDSSTTTPWAASSGGAGGNSVPGSADTVTFDANSGGGTVTLNFGGTVTVQSVAMGGFTSGTWDNSVHSNNFTISGTGGFNGSGGVTRTIKVGSATYTLSNTASNSNPVSFATATGLTLTAGSETWVISGTTTVVRNVFTGGKAIGNLTVNTGAGIVSLSGGGAVATLTINSGAGFVPQASFTATALNFAGLSTAPSLLQGPTYGSQQTITVSSGTPTITWMAIRDIAFTGGATFAATNSFDLGDNTGITITAPSTGGGGGAGVIGS